MKLQEKHSDEKRAIEAAKKMVYKEDYSCVILSKGSYYVENNTPLLRPFETLIAEFERTKKRGFAKRIN